MDSEIKYLIDLETKIYGSTYVQQSSNYYYEDAKKYGLTGKQGTRMRKRLKSSHFTNKQGNIYQMRQNGRS